MESSGVMRTIMVVSFLFLDLEPPQLPIVDFQTQGEDFSSCMQQNPSLMAHRISRDLDSVSNSKGFVLTQWQGRRLGFEHKRIGE
ncbi:hypothetical protein AAZX31_17G006200 [Glycine max]|uniref:Uncharacterized protein n=1 Tax=Glycine max TaxID=3847 RepID=K7MJA9_SOYBN|nr:hypothetical protein JHK86_046118 [Glycine max]KHN03542.1 hypothetical protein glysoja_004568 [Glycine soja]KAG4942014.1 hypothetical protein JHK85_046660 [Glycine max]KAG5096363.1 hypothetical protein JHK82_046217 [Glycine max]KAG5101159.1 hypothetical protein JHK84_046128 [Glycine max]